MVRTLRPTIGVAFALEAEFASWRSRRLFTRAATDTSTFEAAVGPVTVRAAIVGIGARRLPRVAAWLLDPSVEAVIVAGLAGALSPAHRIGEVLVARYISRDGEQRTADPHLLALAASCGAAIAERFVTVDRVVATAAAKRALASAGDAVDMESFDIVDAAQRRGIPAIAVRVVGDAAGDDLPIDFEPAIASDGSVSTLSLAAQALRRPWRWPRLIRFAIDQRRALAALPVVLDSLISAIGTQS